LKELEMFARTVSMRLKPRSAAQFTQLIASKAIPLLRKQKGFQDQITFVDAGGAQAIGISLWDHKENASAYGHSAYPRLMRALQGLVEGTPEVHTYEVSNSTFHKIAAPVAV
jgi:hypothetical protein